MLNKFIIQIILLEDKFCKYNNVIMNDLNKKTKEELLYMVMAYQEGFKQNVCHSITDKKGVIIYANNKFCELSKYTEKELVGSTHGILKTAHHPESFYKDMWATILSGKVWRGEIKNKAKDGSIFWSDSTIIPIFKMGVVSQFLALRIPITEKKILEAKKRAYTKSLESVLYEILHKLRAPVTTCLGLTELLEYKKNPDEELLNKCIDHRRICSEELDCITTKLSKSINRELDDSFGLDYSL